MLVTGSLDGGARVYDLRKVSTSWGRLVPPLYTLFDGDVKQEPAKVKASHPPSRLCNTRVLTLQRHALARLAAL